MAHAINIETASCLGGLARPAAKSPDLGAHAKSMLGVEAADPDCRVNWQEAPSLVTAVTATVHASRNIALSTATLILIALVCAAF